MVRIKDPISGGSHFIGLLLAIVGLFLLQHRALAQGGLSHQLTFLVFGISMTLLYAASSVHHLIPKPIRHAKLWRRIDHAAIFILIAGTYTPICLIALGGIYGGVLNAFVWSLALVGVWLKLSGRRLPRKISTAFYIGLGWTAIVAFFPLLNELSTRGFFWLFFGGALYTIGGVIYALKRPNPVHGVFGHHEIFHFFVMGGSFCHFWTVLNYVR